MIYTQEQLESMSDLELNRIIVREIKGLTLDPLIMKAQDKNSLTTNYANDAVTVVHEPTTERSFFNFCEDWNDCGLLIDELRIETDYVDGFGATATKCSESVSCYDNIKRAVTIVYILVKQSS